VAIATYVFYNNKSSIGYQLVIRILLFMFSKIMHQFLCFCFGGAFMCAEGIGLAIFLYILASSSFYMHPLLFRPRLSHFHSLLLTIMVTKMNEKVKPRKKELTRFMKSI